jgi:hypothetical protein
MSKMQLNKGKNGNLLSKTTDFQRNLFLVEVNFFKKLNFIRIRIEKLTITF